MEQSRYEDIIGGAVLTFGGAALAWYSLVNYGFGLSGQVGPGVFPVSLSVLLAGLGLAIFLTGLRRRGVLPEVEWRPLIWVLASTATFAITVDFFGMIPSVVLTALVACVADRRTGLRQAILLACALTAIAVCIFNIALGVQIPIINWPF